MPLEVKLFEIDSHHRSKVVVQAMAKGISRVGDRPAIKPAVNYRPDDQVIVFYGLVGALAKAIRRQQAVGGTAIYVDLGYWGRRQGGRWTGYHKIAVNSRHPTEYFQRRPHDETRFRRLGVSMMPWKRGRNILIAGMGDKGSLAEGFQPGEWERSAVEQLRKLTDRPIIYRPKPSWLKARTIDGTIFSPPRQKIEEVLADCHAVVTHHSNVAVDGLMDGIPAFCFEGVAVPMALADLTRIEHPEYPADRQRWANDIAWTQWSIAEMAEGLPWRHLKDEGLLPC